MKRFLLLACFVSSVLATNIDHIDEAPRAAPLAAPAAVDAITPLRDVDVFTDNLEQAIRELQRGSVGSFTFEIGWLGDYMAVNRIDPAFLQALKNAKTIHTLRLRLTRVDQDSFVQVIKALRNLPNLGTLDLSGEIPTGDPGFRNAAMEPLADFLRQSLSLRKVRLFFPRVDWGGFEMHGNYPLFESAARQSLTILSLTHLGGYRGESRTICFEAGEKLTPEQARHQVRVALRLRLVGYRDAWLRAKRARDAAQAKAKVDSAS